MGLMNPIISSFYTSYTICASISVWNTLVGWGTGLVLGSTLSMCTTKFRSKPGTLLYSYENISLNSLSNWINSNPSSIASFELIEMGLGFYGSVLKFFFLYRYFFLLPPHLHPLHPLGPHSILRAFAQAFFRDPFIDRKWVPCTFTICILFCR